MNLWVIHLQKKSGIYKFFKYGFIKYNKNPNVPNPITRLDTLDKIDKSFSNVLLIYSTFSCFNISLIHGFFLSSHTNIVLSYF